MAMTVLEFAVAVGLCWLAWRCMVEMRGVLRRKAATRAPGDPKKGLISGAREDLPGDPVDETADEELVELLQQYMLGEERHHGPAQEPNVVGLTVVGSVLLLAALACLTAAIYRLVG